MQRKDIKEYFNLKLCLTSETLKSTSAGPTCVGSRYDGRFPPQLHGAGARIPSPPSVQAQDEREHGGGHEPQWVAKQVRPRHFVRGEPTREGGYGTCSMRACVVAPAFGSRDRYRQWHWDLEVDPSDALIEAPGGLVLTRQKLQQMLTARLGHICGRLAARRAQQTNKITGEAHSTLIGFC